MGAATGKDADDTNPLTPAGCCSLVPWGGIRYSETRYKATMLQAVLPLGSSVTCSSSPSPSPTPHTGLPGISTFPESLGFSMSSTFLGSCTPPEPSPCPRWCSDMPWPSSSTTRRRSCGCRTAWRSTSTYASSPRPSATAGELPTSLWPTPPPA